MVIHGMEMALEFINVVKSCQVFNVFHVFMNRLSKYLTYFIEVKPR